MSEEIHYSPTISHFQRFRLLLWKNYLWHRYYWWWTFVEILARCFLPLFLGLSVSSDINLTTRLTSYPPLYGRDDLLDTIRNRKYLAYSPSNMFTKKLMENVIEKLTKEKNLTHSIELVDLPNGNELAEYMVNRSIFEKESPMGIVFDLNNSETLDEDNFTVPSQLNYEVRESTAHNTRGLVEGDSTPGPNTKRSDYWVGGFAAVQLLLNEEFIRMKSNNSSWSAPNVYFQAFPYPEYETSEIERSYLLNVVVLVLIAAEIGLSVPFITSIILEKQNGIKNLMRVHHMEEILILFSWFIKSFVVILISVTLMTIILKTPFKGNASESVRYTNFSVLWTFLLFFGAANLCLVLFLSAIFNNATIASLVHMFVHYFSLLLLIVTVGLSFGRTLPFFWPSSSYVVANGIHFMDTAEAHGVHFNWTTAGTFHADQSPLTLIPSFFCFAFEIIFYLLLAFFFGFIHSGEYDSQKSLFHVFSYLISGNKHKHSSLSIHQVNVNESIGKSNGASSRLESSLRTEIREPEMPNHEPSLRIEGLSKHFDAVHSFSLDKIDLEFYENEISVLLGPKNSGKTTLFSILAGLVTYDDGYIFYKGFDVSDNLDILKSDLGVCFQEDRLFHFMSIFEHLIFFGMLKGLSNHDAVEETEEFLEKMDLHREQHFAVRYLTPVEKRKLCIAICLIGEPKVLLLDEPLEGLDYKSKIKIWNLLSDMRTDRTIIISTTNAKEAENLADRITVMESGSVIAHGTPKFLKNAIGIHYEIIVSTSKEHFSDITEQVKSVVNATVQRKTESEIVYRVASSNLPEFPNLFKNLETNSQNFGITNINVTVDTIEHVLMRTGGLTRHSSVQPGHTDRIFEDEYYSDYAESATGVRLRLRQLRILFVKKFLYMLKDFRHIFKRIILPSLIAVVLIHLVELINFEPYISKKMSPSIYVLKQLPLPTVRPRVMLHRLKMNRTDDIYKSYSTYIQSHDAIVIDTVYSTLIEHLLSHARKDIMSYRREYLAGYVLKEGATSKIMYNLWPIHSLPIAISIYSNVLLRSTQADETTEIVTRNHPVPSTESGCQSQELFMKSAIILFITYFLFAFLTIDVILYLFEFSNKEMVSGLMYLQIMSGVPAWIYWFATFVFDILFFATVIAFRLVLLFYLDHYYYILKPTFDFVYFVYVLLFFGMAGLMYVYIFSFFYKPKTNSYYTTAFMFNFTCNVGVAMCYSFSILPNITENPFAVHRLLSILFLWVPFLNFPWIILQYISQWWNNNQCFILCSRLLVTWCRENRETKPYLEYSTSKNMYAILLEVEFLYITFFLGGVWFILMNLGFVDFLHNYFKSKNFKKEKTPVGEEMVHEKEEISEIKEDESRYHETTLIADGVGKSFMKIFSLSSMVAVDDVSFIADPGSNFGILGDQGAGKTTTFRMLTGKVASTKGDISVRGVNSHDWKQYHSLIGYCPQTSPLLDKFTGRQMLRLLVSLRGFEHVETIVDDWISITGFEELQHYECDLYSNSDKRLLSTALALIENPEVVFLDEPTKDVDSFTRRHLYNIMEQVRHSGKTVILASSSPNECELLCDRLTILIDGVMYCIGNPYDLKRHHNLGYFLMIKVHPEIASYGDVVRLEKSVLTKFTPKKCRLIEEYRSMLHYQIVDEALPLSTLFRKMQEIGSENPVIEDYTVTTTTIKDILDAFSHPTDFFSSKNRSSSFQISERE